MRMVKISLDLSWKRYVNGAKTIGRGDLLWYARVCSSAGEEMVWILHLEIMMGTYQICLQFVLP